MKLPKLLPSSVLLGAVTLSLVGSQQSSAQTTARNARTAKPLTNTTVVTNDSGTTTSAATSPVGFMTTTCLANTDTNLAIPFTRPAAFIGSVSGGANTSTTTGTITFSSASFTASAFKYVQGTQSNKYYAYVTGGTKEGAIYDITDNTANALTINTNGDNISAIASGVQVRIIPHWTLATAFTIGQSIIGTTTINNATTQVLVPNQTTAGTDLLAGATYYYYAGSFFGGPGWRALGDFNTIYNDTVLYPETYFTLRNNTANALSFVPVGSVSTLATATTTNGTATIGVNIATVLNTLAANTDQDNAVALPVAVDTTLANSNLYQSGAFTGSSVIGGSAGDQLLVYNNATTGTDKLAAKTYYYYTGAVFGGPGWRSLQDGFSTLDNTDVLKAGVGFIVRKRGTSTPQSVIWNYRPVVAP